MRPPRDHRRALRPALSRREPKAHQRHRLGEGASHGLTVALCPGCSYRLQEPESGLCKHCEGERVRSAYIERELAEVSGRRRVWSTWASSSRENLRDRQRRHRLKDRIRPRRAPPRQADPLVLGAEAIASLVKVKRVVASAEMREQIEEAIERIRWLASGPGQ